MLSKEIFIADSGSITNTDWVVYLLASPPSPTIVSHTPDMPGKARIVPITGTHLRKLMAIGKNPPNRATNP